MDAINEKIDYGSALFGGNDITQDSKIASPHETKKSTTEEVKNERSKEAKNKRNNENQKSKSKDVKKTRLAVNITMVDDSNMAIRKRAIKMKAKTWILIDEALQEYLKNYTAQSKEARKSRHQEVKNSGKKRHPANITMVEDTKTAIWLLALKENVSPWVLIEEALSLFGDDKLSRNQEVV